MTRRQKHKAANEAWRLALSEQRVLRFSSEHLVAYPTLEARDAALAEAIAEGMDPQIIQGEKGER